MKRINIRFLYNLWGFWIELNLREDKWKEFSFECCKSFLPWITNAIQSNEKPNPFAFSIQTTTSIEFPRIFAQWMESITVSLFQLHNLWVNSGNPKQNKTAKQLRWTKELSQTISQRNWKAKFRLQVERRNSGKTFYFSLQLFLNFLFILNFEKCINKTRQDTNKMKDCPTWNSNLWTCLTSKN